MRATTGGCPYKGLGILKLIVGAGFHSWPVKFEISEIAKGGHRGPPLQMHRYFKFIVGAGFHAGP